MGRQTIPRNKGLMRWGKNHLYPYNPAHMALANRSHKGETARCCQKATLEQPRSRWFACPQHPLHNTKYIVCLAEQISIDLSQQSQPQIRKMSQKVATLQRKRKRQPTLSTHETHRSAWAQGAMVLVAARSCQNGHLEQPYAVTGRWHQRNMLNMEPWCHGVTIVTRNGVY